MGEGISTTGRRIAHFRHPRVVSPACARCRGADRWDEDATSLIGPRGRENLISLSHGGY